VQSPFIVRIILADYSSHRLLLEGASHNGQYRLNRDISSGVNVAIPQHIVYPKELFAWRTSLYPPLDQPQHCA